MFETRRVSGLCVHRIVKNRIDLDALSSNDSRIIKFCDTVLRKLKIIAYGEGNHQFPASILKSDTLYIAHGKSVDRNLSARLQSAYMVIYGVEGLVIFEKGRGF